jgi:FdhD protein
VEQIIPGHPQIWKQGQWDAVDQSLIAEEPLAIYVQGQPYSVVMRTPGDEKAHAAGFCLSEGLIDRLEDIASLACCDTGDTNIVTLTLTPGRRDQIGPLLARRGFISQTSCGICGKALVADLAQILSPMDRGAAIKMVQALQCIEALNTAQDLRRRTRATHAAAIFNTEMEMMAMAEDVGRHNALDKAIGKVFLAGRLPAAALVVMSSRISYELVQRTARARIPIFLSVSRPTALAVELAGRLDVTLACLAPEDGVYIYGGTRRLI